MRYHPTPIHALAILLCGLSAGCSNVQWYDYQSGVQRVQQERRRAVIEFTTAWSAEARSMEDVFVDEEIQRLMERFVAIRMDAVMDKTLADQLGVTTVPTFFVLRPDMTVAGSAAGVMTVDQFRGFLIKHSFD